MRNQIFVTIDSLRWDTFQEARLPFLRSLGLWKKAFTQATYTFPAHMSFFVGKLPQTIDQTDHYDTVAARCDPVSGRLVRNRQLYRLDNPEAPRSALITLDGGNIVEGFRRQGYTTVGTGAVSWFNPALPAGRYLTEPFEHYKFFDGPHHASHASACKQVDWVHQTLAGRSTPWFLFVNFGETHHRFVYEGCPWFDDRFQYGDAVECKRRQRACLEYLDGQIQRLLQRFSGYDLVICSDHGEAFGEDGLWGHGFYHPTIMQVPMLIKVAEDADRETQGTVSSATIPPPSSAPCSTTGLRAKPQPENQPTALSVRTTTPSLLRPPPLEYSPAARPFFVSFLLPYIDRGHGPLYQWVMELQAACLGADGVAFIGDDSYFQTALPWGEEMNLFGFCYRCPTSKEWERFAQNALPQTIFAELERRSRSMLDAFRILLTEDYAPLREALETMLASICATRKPDAILSWCHVPSLKLAAAKFGIPVIHNELGPLRPPTYQSTVYLDFGGVNGFTSAAEQMRQFSSEAAGWSDFQPLSLAELRDLLILRPGKRALDPSQGSFEAGVALQVEDDSNLLAFSYGMSNFELLHAVRRFARREEILFRHHPHGHARYTDRLGAVDESADSIEFLSRCKHLYTTNSSVAFEALLQDLPVTTLGDTPAAGASYALLQAMSPEARLLCLNWLFVGYLVPAARLFDANYYRWRLTQPALRAIFERHLADFRAGAEQGEPAYQDQPRPALEAKAANPKLAEVNKWRAPVRESLQRRITELEQWNQELQRQAGTGGLTLPDGNQAYPLIPHLNEAHRTKGQPDQVAVWEATIDGPSMRAIYMQPPAELNFRVPVGAHGFLVTAAAIHPDAWEKPEAGGCEFHLRVDGRLALVLALDPAHLPGDRHWHDLKLEIPENASGHHQITLETRAIGGSEAYRWALWRSPHFKWMDAKAGEAIQ